MSPPPTAEELVRLSDKHNCEKIINMTVEESMRLRDTIRTYNAVLVENDQIVEYYTARLKESNLRPVYDRIMLKRKRLMMTKDVFSEGSVNGFAALSNKKK